MKGGEPEHFPFTYLCNILTFALKESIAWVPFFQLVTPSDGVLGDQGPTLSLDFCQIVLCNLFMDCDSNYNKLDQSFEQGFVRDMVQHIAVCPMQNIALNEVKAILFGSYPEHATGRHAKR